ncbi:ATP-binding cassette domain-containing protein [Phytoactinopolyspora halotolerans]|uniref:ATP-binding cassette domain-containing protein n=1 Tax=Phytoactinopolyspora halotolerans TaxID=1981512 RepID=A0A6L9S440_9ACTN|nr:ATP-binding cassette domain-containing protein [Phytoactinopolyspora halotolerans]NED99798.1 ATP-binding cassette domain-containing protein [Phytoactinopolyspora halotolerans]
MNAIIAEGLTKTFGSGEKAVKAVSGVDLSVDEGTVVGILGPNGAGKTTTVRMLTTLLPLDSGRATVAGHDVVREPQAVRASIGLSGQFAAVDENLTGRENLWMFGRLYQLSSKEAKKRADELLEQFSLTDAADRPSKTYSGGMRRRLDLAGSLVIHPRVLFLDEPTTGLDPASRLDLWDVIRERVSGGATILLTTQYLEEADVLADRIVVIDQGRIIAEGTADELKAKVGGERIEVVVHDPDMLHRATEILQRGSGGQCQVDEHTRRLTVPSTAGSKGLVQVIRDLDEQQVDIDDIALRRPTLDDVFLELTGHKAEEKETKDDQQSADSVATQGGAK